MASPNIDISNIVATINEGIGQTDLGSVTADISVTWEVLNNASINISNDGNLSLTSDADFDAIQSYTFQIKGTDVADGTNSTTTGDITVNVNNLPPVIDSSNLLASVDDGVTSLGSLSVTFGTTTWTKLGGDGDIQINSSTGAVTLDNPADNQDDPGKTILVRATDGGGLTADGTFTVNVNDITSPVINTTNITTSVAEGVTTFGSVSSTEPVTWGINVHDGTNVQIETVNDNNANINFPDGTNFQNSSSHQFNITATDNAGNLTITTQITVDVIDGTAPTLTTNFVASIDDGLTALGSISSNESVTWSISGDSVQITTVDGNNANVTATSSANFQTKSSYSFTVSGIDSAGNSATTDTITINVNDITPPVLTSNFQATINDGDTNLGSISSNEPVNWSINGVDVEINTVDNQNATVDLLSAANYQTKTSYSFTVTGTDLAGNITTTGNISVSVDDSTFPAITSNIVASINDGLYSLGSVTASETVTWSINDLDSTGITIDQNGDITLSNEANSHVASSHRFTVSAEDLTGNITTTDEFNVPVNDITNPTVINITSSNNNGSYKSGEVIVIQLEFNEPVNVIGNPYINMNVTTGGYPVYYTSGTGSSTLEFNYKILNSHYTASLDYVNSTALYLNNGSIKDNAGNDLNLSLAFPGDPNSFSANRSIVIDTNAIFVDDFNLSRNTLSKGESVDISIRFSKIIPSLNESNFAIRNGILSTLNTDDSGFTWITTFTPFNNIIDYTNKIILTSSYVDQAGNTGPVDESPVIQIDTTGATTYTTSRGSAPKDATSSSGGFFSMSRIAFTRTIAEQYNTQEEKQIKRFYGASSSSSVIARKKKNAIGGGSLNTNNLMQNSFSNNKYISDSALRKLRS